KTGDLTAPAHVASIDSVTTAYTIGLNWDAVENADYYEIKFDGMLYSTIRKPHFQFNNLQPEQTYSFKLRAVNKSGVSDWSQKKITTRKNPLEFAIKGIMAKASFPAQGGRGIQNLVDFDESNIWHTTYDSTTQHFNVVFDLKSINSLDKLEYLPRRSGVNGMILQGEVYYSMDKASWTSAGKFTWERTHAKKVFSFDQNPQARYVKVEVTKNYGGYGSGRELYIFKVPNTASQLPGDVNHDDKVDESDLTSYLNYTGLRKGDADFDGYIGKGDLNQNGLIDAYD